MRVFVGAVIAIGALCLWIDLIPFDTSDPTQFLPYFVMSALAAGLRVSMSTYRGTLSINFLFVLIGLVHLTLSELGRGRGGHPVPAEPGTPPGRAEDPVQPGGIDGCRSCRRTGLSSGANWPLHGRRDVTAGAGGVSAITDAYHSRGDLGRSLSLQETLSVLATRLKRLVRFDSLAIYFLRDGK